MLRAGARGYGTARLREIVRYSAKRKPRPSMRGDCPVDLPPGTSAAVQRDAEAAIVAQICSRLIGAVQIERADGSKGWLAPGDIALLAPTGTDLWRYERALEKVGLAVASQAGKTLVLRQETQDILALLRSLADPRDTLAFGAFLRGPMVGLTDEELLDIAEAVHQSAPEDEPERTFNLHTPLDMVSHPLARSVLAALQQLRRRVAATTPRFCWQEQSRSCICAWSSLRATATAAPVHSQIWML